MNKRAKPKRPPKRGAATIAGRPIDRLQPADRERIRANVAAFLLYAAQSRRRRGYG